jgi:hypothetical protein
MTPLFDFTGHIPDILSFYTRRSSSHAAPVVLEASVDSGNTFTVLIGDTLVNTGTTSYVASSFDLPPSLALSRGVQFRWRVIADSTGSTGTFRIDDVSVTVKTAIDLELGGIRFVPPQPVEGDSVHSFALVRNSGLQSVQNFLVEFYLDANNDSIPQPSELVATAASTSPLMPSDSAELSALLGLLPPGTFSVIGRILYPPDENPLNNQWHISLIIGYPAHTVVINEIMYAPTNTEPEWIELYNTRADSISLMSWLVSDNNTTTKRTITNSNILIPPTGYIILAKDSAALMDIHPAIISRVIDMPDLPTLNNSGDAVVIYDNRVATMDSVAYMPAWGGNTGGRSLERVDPLGASTLQSNWGSSRHADRSTPGMRNSLTRKDFDLKIDTTVILPAFPYIGDSLVLVAAVTNVGLMDAGPFTMLFYSDANQDSVGQPDELIDSVSHPLPVMPLDSVDISFPVAPRGAGYHFFIARVSFAPDEDTSNNEWIALSIVGHPSGSVRINEIMYAPPSGVPEWIELLNVSPDTIDLKNWKTGNRAASRYAVTGSTTLVPPGAFAVFTKDSALLLQAYIHLSAPVVQSSSLPTFLWNNNGDAVVLLDSRGALMDSVFYSTGWGGASGTSLERVDALAMANDSTNWGSSVDSIGATPGRVNSVAPVDHDLRVSRAPPVSVRPGETALLSIPIRNVGKLPSTAFRLLIYDDINSDSAGTPDELVGQQSAGSSLAPGESLLVSFEWADPLPGLHPVVAFVEYTPDLRLSNNTAWFPLRVAYAQRTVVVNEIMYSPLTGQAEYVELYNASQEPVNLDGWSIADRPTSTGSVNEFLLAPARRILNAGEFFVIASDSSVFSLFPHMSSFDTALVTVTNGSSLSLNNDGDDVVLRDLTGFPIDSVPYSPSWHNPGVTDQTGRSLEKIHPQLAPGTSRSWSTCARSIGGTPGLQNSIYAASLPSNSRFSFSPNPFSPDGDGMDDFTIIRYEVPLQVSVIRIRIFDVKGRLIRTLANSEPSGSTGQTVWDGRDDDNTRARIGMYIVFLEAIDDRGGILETAKGVVVLAARL